MSPNNKNLSNSDLEDKIEDINLNQYIHQFSSEEEDEQILNNGYTLLNQDLNQHNEELNDDSEYESSYLKDDENELRNGHNSNQSDHANDSQPINNVESRLKFNSNDQFFLEETSFQREYDKKELNSNEPNQIHLNEDKIDQIKECMRNINLPNLPSWANSTTESELKLTNFIYKRLKQ